MVKEIKKKGEWEDRDSDIRRQKKKTWEALKRWSKTREESDREALREEKRRLKEIRKSKKEEEMTRKKQRLESSKTMTEFWEAIKEFRARRKRKGEGIRKKEWLEHFKKLLDGIGERGEEEKKEEEEREEGKEGEEGVEELDKEITIEEVQRALGKMRNGKAEGEDGIVAEFLKNLSSFWLDEVRTVLNEILGGEDIIQGWKTARIYPIHKGGEEEEVRNYRGVALLDSGYKLFAMILENRLRNCLEKNEKLKESQAGFRKGRGTREHIFVLNSLINNSLKREKGRLYACFVDFKTAFDSIDREKMMEKLEKMGTEKFRVKKGVRQGCPLSVLLFLIYLEDLEERWTRKNEGGVVIGKDKIYCLKFADDVVVLADSAAGLRDMIKDLERFSDGSGLEVNEKKAKVMIFRKGGREGKEKWKYKNRELEVVKEYKYLGF